MKKTSTLGPDSAAEGRRQNRGEIPKNIGERSEPQSTARPASLVDIFVVWPRFLPSSPTAEPGPRLPFNFPSPDYLSARSPAWFSGHAQFFYSSPSTPLPISLRPPLHAEPVDVFLFSLRIKGLITLAKLNWCGGLMKRVKMVETVYHLCQPSMFTTMFPFKFFFPFGINLSLYDRKYESDQNPERSQLKRFPHGEDL